MHKFVNKSKTPPNLKDEWDTPISFFDQLDTHFEFDLDPCAKAENLLGVDTFFTKNDNGLNKDWSDYPNIFINPPYSEIEQWLIRGWHYCIHNKFNNQIENIVYLLPASTGVRWFHYYLWDAENMTSKNPSIVVRFMKRRLQFERPYEIKNDKDAIVDSGVKKESATFDTMLVFFTNNQNELLEKLTTLYYDKDFIW